MHLRSHDWPPGLSLVVCLLALIAPAAVASPLSMDNKEVLNQEFICTDSCVEWIVAAVHVQIPAMQLTTFQATAEKALHLAVFNHESNNVLRQGHQADSRPTEPIGLTDMNAQLYAASNSCDSRATEPIGLPEGTADQGYACDSRPTEPIALR